MDDKRSSVEKKLKRDRPTSGSGHDSSSGQAPGLLHVDDGGNESMDRLPLEDASHHVDKDVQTDSPLLHADEVFEIHEPPGEPTLCCEDTVGINVQPSSPSDIDGLVPSSDDRVVVYQNILLRPDEYSLPFPRATAYLTVTTTTAGVATNVTLHSSRYSCQYIHILCVTVKCKKKLTKYTYTISWSVHIEWPLNVFEQDSKIYFKISITRFTLSLTWQLVRQHGESQD